MYNVIRFFVCVTDSAAKFDLYGTTLSITSTYQTRPIRMPIILHIFYCCDLEQNIMFLQSVCCDKTNKIVATLWAVCYVAICVAFYFAVDWIYSTQLTVHQRWYVHKWTYIAQSKRVHFQNVNEHKTNISWHIIAFEFVGFSFMYTYWMIVTWTVQRKCIENTCFVCAIQWQTKPSFRILLLSLLLACLLPRTAPSMISMLQITHFHFSFAFGNKRRKKKQKKRIHIRIKLTKSTMDNMQCGKRNAHISNGTER